MTDWITRIIELSHMGEILSMFAVIVIKMLTLLMILFIVNLIIWISIRVFDISNEDITMTSVTPIGVPVGLIIFAGMLASMSN